MYSETRTTMETIGKSCKLHRRLAKPSCEGAKGVFWTTEEYLQEYLPRWFKP